MRLALTLLITFLSTPDADAVQEGTFQQASISKTGDSLCVSIRQDKKADRSTAIIRGVSLGERTPSGAHYVWRAYFVPAGLEEPSVTAGQCIPYEKISPFPELHAGKAYELSITGDSDGSVRFYKAFFCMVDVSGTLDIHPVQFDRKRKVWAWDACPGVALP